MRIQAQCHFSSWRSYFKVRNITENVKFQPENVIQSIYKMWCPPGMFVGLQSPVTIVVSLILQVPWTIVDKVINLLSYLGGPTLYVCAHFHSKFGHTRACEQTPPLATELFDEIRIVARSRSAQMLLEAACSIDGTFVYSILSPSHPLPPHPKGRAACKLIWMWSWLQ